VTRSYWGNDALAKDTYLTRPSDASGTSFLIVGAYDPSGEAETVEEMADQLRRALAQNFWPAMVERGDDAPARLSAIVRAQRNERVITEQFVDPEQFEPAKVAALRHHFADDVTDILSAAGDVVRATVSLKVPRRVAPESEHPAVQHEPIVLVAQADDGDDDANHIAYLRGSHMIVHDPQLSGLPVGAIPFHAIVLAGEAAGATTADRAAERFLRAAEPPAHNRWTSTPDVNAAYARGGPSAIRAMDEEIRKLIRDLVRQPVSEKSDGPESLKELLRLTPPKPEVERRPRVKAAKGQLDDDGTWDVEATISLPPRDRPWSLRPVLRFGTESGPPIPVKWSSLAAVANCEVLDGRLVAEGSARQVRFRGRTDPRSYPVGATRAKILVDVRTDAEESRADIDGEPS
jgi:RNA polymerase primary sigma factor